MIDDVFDVGTLFGDVLIKGPIGLSAWLVGGRRTRLWQDEIVGHPWRNWVLGVLLWVIVAYVTIAFIAPRFS